MPLSGKRHFPYVYRLERINHTGEKSLKKKGPFCDLSSLTFTDAWANGMKSILGESPVSYNFDEFFQILSGGTKFGPKQAPETTFTGWAGELLGLLSFLQTRSFDLDWQNVCRITQVSGRTKYPDFAVYDYRTSSVLMLECKAAFKVYRGGAPLLDLCATLDEKRKDGKQKIKNSATYTWFKDGSGHRIYITAFPADSIIVAALTFVDGAFAKATTIRNPNGCPHATIRSCVDTCLHQSSETAASAIIFFSNPAADMQHPKPPIDTQGFFLELRRLQRAAWASTPATFWSALQSILELDEQGAPPAKNKRSSGLEQAFRAY